MGKVSVAEIKELMTATGVGMMDCKKALVEADGDMEKAVTLLREKGLATQAKKSGRVAAEGICTAVVKGNVGCVLEVNIETDFAANNDEFKAFVHQDQREHGNQKIQENGRHSCSLRSRCR